ncbi:unnamed protein product [Lymnaea stagnalis]|uniref:Uncharacterized protein n=1 Tax=Lymnaea stagnalis TaxID=6523 RepID=A0AAV2H4L2_LYMST
MHCCCSTSKPYKGQDYWKLRKRLLKEDSLFVDGAFPNDNSSLYYSRAGQGDVIWKRPKDIVADPKFFIDSASADDFSQGSLGDCWFVAACACLVRDKTLWKKVVPDFASQVFSPPTEYAGIFHFKFWRLGTWVDVVIDDYLPTRHGQLIYTHSSSKNEFWSALLEKAYAKLFGSYEALTSGKSRDALVDLTGGIGEGLKMAEFRTVEGRSRLFQMLLEAKANLSLMCASAGSSNASQREAKQANGLVLGHAYSLTDVRKIPLKGSGILAWVNRRTVPMIRLRNPWGRDEWRGAWSDGSPEWEQVSDSDLRQMSLAREEDGEFWMSLEDFCQHFTDIDICHIMQTTLFTLKKTWRERVATGSWSVRQRRAGGCSNHPTVLDNPQFIVEFASDEKEVFISLEQEDRRSLGQGNHCIGVSLRQTDLNRKYRMHDTMAEIHSASFIDARSILSRLPLKKGRYCLIPSTFNPGYEGKFLLRLYSSGSVLIKELTKDMPGPPRCFGRPTKAATAVSVKHLEGLRVPNLQEGIEAYCVIKCEKQALRTATSARSSRPEWKDRVTFYRRSPSDDIVIEAWVKNVIKDDLIGKMTLTQLKATEQSQGDKIWRHQLKRVNTDGKEEHQGYIWVKVKHTTDLMDV